jgi:hypothetical protein
VSYRERVLAKIQRYTSADRDDVARFRADVYGKAAFFSQPDYLRWMYEQTSDLDVGASPLWLFRPAGEIEGQQGGVRAALHIGGERFEALWATELVVSPDYLLRGVGAVLSGLATAETQLTIGFEVTELAKRAFLRAGWIDLGDVPLFMRPLDVGALLSARGKNLPALLTRTLNATLRAVDVAVGAATRSRRLTLVETSRFDARSDQIWAASAASYQVIGQRDAATLNWRYIEFPRAGYYQAFYAYRGAEPVGHAVLRIDDHGGVPAGWIVDFLCPPEHVYGLLTACVRWFARERVAAVYCIQQRSRLAKSFAAAGFLTRSTGWPLMVLAPGVPESARTIVLDPANWFITGGDGNVDHPRQGTEYAT